MQTTASANEPLAPLRWWRESEFWLLIALVVGIYFTRITALPIVGEEPRWARGAAEMLESGDWIVTRQQGQPFPERPPMTCWLMALVGMMRGSVDGWAIRLPSVIAMVLIAGVIYVYGRNFMTAVGALAGGVVYVTMGQVLQLGRMGESESVFVFFLASSLLVWHLGFSRNWHRLPWWLGSYSLVALAALVKGPQAPAYFAAAVGPYLLLKGKWRELFHVQHGAGIGLFVAIIAIWQVPFYWATDLAHVKATWFGLAADRFNLQGLLRHALKYPFETFGCLLPWSPLLLVYFNREFRQALGSARDMVVFLALAVAVTYPTVWFASAARGRYFMPLYPCLAILIGVVIERASLSFAATRLRNEWIRTLRGYGVVVLGAGVFVGVVSFVPVASWQKFAQPLWLAVLVLIAGGGIAVALWQACSQNDLKTTRNIVMSLGVFWGLMFTGFMTNVNRASWNDISPAIREVRNTLPNPESLVSFGPVDHRFCYFFERTIPELPWPTSAHDVPRDVTYFCIDSRPSDSANGRLNGRGRKWNVITGDLPFRWEPVATVPVERRGGIANPCQVVIGKILGPLETAERSDDNVIQR